MKIAVGGVVAIAAVVVQKREHPGDFAELFEVTELGHKLLVIIGSGCHADIMTRPRRLRKRKIVPL